MRHRVRYQGKSKAELGVERRRRVTTSDECKIKDASTDPDAAEVCAEVTPSLHSDTSTDSLRTKLWPVIARRALFKGNETDEGRAKRCKRTRRSQQDWEQLH